MENEKPVEENQLRAAQSILKKYKEPNFRKLIDKVTSEEKSVILQTLEDLKDPEKKNSYWEWVGAITDEPKTEESKKKRKIRASDNPDWIWDNEDIAKRFMATPYLNSNYSKDMSDEDKAALKEDYKAYKKMGIDDFLKSKDFQPFYEYVEEDEDVKPNNYTSKSLWGEGEGNPYADLDKVLDEWDAEDIDTNDNDKVEVDELSAYTKDLEDYLDKNPDAKKKNYY